MPAERILWSKLRSAQVEGTSFRRQHPIGPYVLDFYCPTLSLALELDGGQHGNPERNDKDRARDAWLRARGIQVLRFWNSDIFSNLDGVLEEIRRVILSLNADMTTPGDPSPPLRGDPPLSGEGEVEPRHRRADGRRSSPPPERGRTKVAPAAFRRGS
jgi:very-short-patch-repair endonuclease